MRIREAIFACTVFLAAATVSSAAEPGKKVDSALVAVSWQMGEGLEMAEDLEIMGAVLRTALTETYSRPKVQPVTRKDRYSGWSGQYRIEVELEGSAVPSIGRPDGTYLPGYGVVYQVTVDVPAPERRSSEDAAENADDQLGPVQVETLEGLDVLVVRGQKADVDRAMKVIASGEWKDTARRLRGDPPAQPPSNVVEAWQMPSADDLLEKLLDVLAENAGNFRHLKAQDRLAVAITFPRSKAPAAATNNSAATSFASALLNRFDSQAGRYTHEVSGDLHMRQKNYKAAVEAYENVLKRLIPNHPSKPVIARKLIGAYVAAGDLKKAQEWIELLKTQYPDGSHSQTGASGSPGTRTIPLPARLVVSVPKSRLDDVAAGKMKPEELKGHATVDYFNPPADRPGLDPPNPGPSGGRGVGGDSSYGGGYGRSSYGRGSYGVSGGRGFMNRGRGEVPPSQ